MSQTGHMPPVNEEQFRGLASRLTEPDGGFSIRTTTGHEPGSGYMVSQADREERYPASHGDVTHEHLMQYAGKNQQELERPGRFMGGWNNPDNGDRDLDVSQHYTSHDRAIKTSIANDQDALYNMNDWHSERNFQKLGTEGSGIGHIIHEGPDPDYHKLQGMARASLKSRPARPPQFLRGR